MAVNEDLGLPCMGARFHAVCRAPLENDAFTSHFLGSQVIIPPYPGKAISRPSWRVAFYLRTLSPQSITPGRLPALPMQGA
jgi:hypothetical protein